MFGWYKKYDYIFWIALLCVLGIDGILLYYGFVTESFFVIVPIAFGWVLFNHLRQKCLKDDAEMYAFKLNCQIDEYIKRIKRIYDKENRYELKMTAAYDLAVGYSVKGEFEKAKDLLNMYVPEQPMNDHQARVKALFHTCLAGIYARAGEQEKVAAEVKKIRDMFGMYPMSPVTLDSATLSYSDAVYYEIMAKGEYSEAAKMLEHTMPTHVTILGKVATKYDLAVCYMNMGEVDQAKELFEFVAANGGETFYVAEAKKQLEEISK